MHDLELEKAISAIKKEKAKLVVIQLPDGLKPDAGMIKKELEQNTEAKVIIWGGSCFGACDIPTSADNLGADMLIQWGHSEWR